MTSSDPYYGRVVYTHAGGIDQPIEIVRLDYDHGNSKMVVVPHANWRGTYDMLTFTTQADQSFCGPHVGHPLGGYECLPVELLSVTAFREPESKHFDGSEGGPRSWFGNILNGQRDGSGLVYRRNRYYDPKQGRFTQEDPIGLAGGINLYGFAGGDPVNFSDPFGLKVCFRGRGWRQMVQTTEQATYSRITLDDENCVESVTPTSKRKEAGILQSAFQDLVNAADVYTIQQVEGGGSNFDPATQTISADYRTDLERTYPVMRNGRCGGAASYTSRAGILAHELGHAHLFSRGGNYRNEDLANAYQNLYAANSRERLPYRCAYGF